MCIAIHKPEGKKLHEYVLRNSFNRNDDGAGFAYISSDNKLAIKKGFMDVEEFIKAVREVEEHEMIIHCRLMSKGEVSEDNCHPFHIQSKMFKNFEFAVIHNGTLPHRSTEKRSDTSFFCEDFLKPLVDRDPYFFGHDICRAMLASYIGTENKLVVMQFDHDKNEYDVNIINRARGVMYAGCWFSNMSFTEEQCRFAAVSDTERMKNWTPKLWTEPVTAPYYGGTAVGFGNNYGDGFNFDEDDRYYRGSQGGGQAAKKETGVSKSSLKDWKWHAGFGWYNTDEAYTGGKSIRDYRKWMEKHGGSDKLALVKVEANNGQVRTAAAGEEPKNKPKPGEKVDDMEWLPQSDWNLARKSCVAVIEASYKDFNFKGLSTQEIAAWARADLRDGIDEFNALTNSQLMNVIMHGDPKGATVETK